MTAVVKCKECDGKGVLEFTKEYGGPTCNICGGKGFMSAKVVRQGIAFILDSPSVHMGGPSQASLRRADKVIEYLTNQSIVNLP